MLQLFGKKCVHMAANTNASEHKKPIGRFVFCTSALPVEYSSILGVTNTVNNGTKFFAKLFPFLSCDKWLSELKRQM